MSTVYFDVSTETISKVAEGIKNSANDSVLVLAPIAGASSVHAPTTKGKYKGMHRLKFEVWIPEEAIKGDSALADFGITTVMRLPKKRVADHLLK